MPPTLNLAANAVANSGGSHADAHGTVSLQPLGNWGLTLGTIRAWGNASVSSPGAFANANSSANDLIWGGPVWWRWGWIRWQPVLWSSVSGSASASMPWPRRRDPISYQIYNSFGNLTESDEMMHINVDGTGDGGFDWNSNNLISMNPSAQPGSSLIWDMSILDDPLKNYIRDQDEGLLKLVYQNGVVTESTHTGQFAAWLLPPVGWSGPWQLQGQQIDLGIDFQRPVDAMITLETSVVPAPPALILGGLGLAAAAAGLKRKGLSREV